MATAGNEWGAYFAFCPIRVKKKPRDSNIFPLGFGAKLLYKHSDSNFDRGRRAGKLNMRVEIVTRVVKYLDRVLLRAKLFRVTLKLLAVTVVMQ